MRTYCWVGTAFVGAVLVAWGAARPRPDASPPPPPDAEGDGPAGREADYPAQVRAVRARLAAKEEAVRALLAGDCTLLEAAARFRELDAWEPRVRWEAHPAVYAGDTEAERYCRAVLVWAGSVARSYSAGDELAEGLAAVRRLEGELEGHRLCGTLALPPAAPGGEGAPCPPSS
jgi:hypothetical protein